MIKCQNAKEVINKYPIQPDKYSIHIFHTYFEILLSFRKNIQITFEVCSC